MPWVRIDDNLPSHPKFLKVGVRGIGLYVTGLCYSNAYLTDGFVPLAAVSTVAGEDMTDTIENLVVAGLWTRTDHGFFIHDFHQFQPKKRAILRDRKQAKRRKQKYLEKARRTLVERRSDVNPDPTPPDPTRPSTCTVPPLDGFDRFWQAYPRKVGKVNARREWLRLAPSEETTTAILRAVTAQRDSAQWQQENGKYIPHPLTWLHGGRWEDELPESGEDARELFNELWRSVGMDVRPWLQGATVRIRDGVIEIVCRVVEKLETVRAQLEAVLHELRPGVKLEIVETQGE